MGFSQVSGFPSEAKGTNEKERGKAAPPKFLGSPVTRLWMNGKKKLGGGATFTPLLRTFIRRVSWILAKGPVLGFVAAMRSDFSILAGITQR
jgi:hypothetical protein